MPGTLLPDRLLRRELGNGKLAASKTRGLYGDRLWVDQLDITNELDGHSGCVNALSWSKSGSLLASGSDDTHLNIHSFQPQHSTSLFKLDTTISTGHSANIFSVKFMPHSNDRTLISAAGDAEIRIFDIEYAGQSAVGGGGSSARASGLTHQGVRYLSEGDTNARVYRSHSDRVKRLVTEQSPYLFLSCSEDGEVRQWDLRQPSSAYPRPSGSRGFSRRHYAGEAPPPLISYKRHQLDLNTISCSPSQPHYIALGGAHLHCFLHDRRMLGRDVSKEKGEKANFSSSTCRSNAQEGLLSEATQCVRRFAPQGQQKMKRNQTGHVTALKISDANPREMIVSWSSDWIYNFDLIRSPDAHEQRRRSSTYDSDRKRKRKPAGSALSRDGAARSKGKGCRRRSATESPQQGEDGSVALKIRYNNGQSERVPMVHDNAEDASNEQGATVSPPRSEQQQISHNVAKLSVRVRQRIFDLDDASGSTEEDPTGYGVAFAAAQDFCAKALPIMDTTMQKWRYPMEPDDVDIVFQNTLRGNRDRSRRFIQACGTLSRVLARKPGCSADSQEVILQNFTRVASASFERCIENTSEKFSYDFLKAILLWLDSGVGGLLRGFSSANHTGLASRNPLPEDASVESVDELLIPYLLSLASNRAIPNVDASRFEVDENRSIFDSEAAAVRVFGRAIKIPFEDLSGASASRASSDSQIVKAQDRKSAIRYWGLRVGRGLLMNAGEGVTFSFVDKAFGGLGTASAEIEGEEASSARRREHIDPDADEPTVESVGVVSGRRGRRTATVESADTSDDDMIAIDDVRDAMMADAAATTTTADDDSDTADTDNYIDDEDDDNSDDDGASATSSTSSSEEEEDEDLTNSATLLHRAFARSTRRTAVHPTIPCASPHLTYRGHANTRTVKDVNFYGLNDEYVVSGSDSGHLFIWDRATSHLLNILEGDGEVVNVVQGHPYEPMLAVSGIDHTVKIFSPDARARRNARKGVGVSSADASNFSSLRLGGRNRFGTARRSRTMNTNTNTRSDAGLDSSADFHPDNENDPDSNEIVSSDDEHDRNESTRTAPNGLSSRRRMHDEYRITSQNDVDRRGAGAEGGGGAGGAAFITRGMLAQLAARVQMRRRAAAANAGGGGGGGGNGRGMGIGLDGAGDEEGQEQGEGGGDDGDGGEGALGVDEDGLPVMIAGDGRVVLAPDCGVQ